MTGPMIFSREYDAHLRTLEALSWWNAGMRDVAKMLLARGHLPSRGRLLDVGCGSGLTMSWFKATWPGWTGTGIDVSPEALRSAGEHGERVCGASALTLPFPDRNFDAVVCLDVLQHLPLDGGDVMALREIRRVLQVGGTLLLRTNAQSVPRVADDPRHSFHKYSRAELRGKLAATGFQVIRIGRLNALLGLAEIPRELRAHRLAGNGYVGHLGQAPKPGVSWRLKRGWLRVEGALVAGGLSLPLGRTLLALARATPDRGS